MSNIKSILVAVICTCAIQFASAQEWVNTINTNSWHQPEYNNFPDLESVGIGDFVNGGVQPRSAFEINTNFYFGPNATPSYVNLGEVFRSSCPEDLSTYWRMWRVSGGTDTEFGNIYSLSRNEDYTNTQTGIGNNFYIQASSHADEFAGDIRFNTGTGGTNQFNSFSQPRMRILGTDGFVGIGDYDVFLPIQQLHQHLVDNTNVFHQFTNGNTGTADTDGFRVGLRFSNDAFDGTYSIAELRQIENAPMVMYTNDLERLRITTDDPYALGNFVTRVGIFSAPFAGAFMWRPLSTLHLGTPWLPNAGTHRLWMDVGTYSTAGTDAMYVGLKNNDMTGGGHLF